jgi:hypothetical protein
MTAQELIEKIQEECKGQDLSKIEVSGHFSIQHKHVQNEFNTPIVVNLLSFGDDIPDELEIHLGYWDIESGEECL